ncbi:MAG: pectinacetylesterase family protein, partial [Anaerolineae bacterium]|nr:pectinacetylesterase family protein [Anaerolineae bacterium]
MQKNTAVFKRFWKPGVILCGLITLFISGIIFVLPVFQQQNRYHSYLQSLKSSGFNKYLKTPAEYSDVIKTHLWDVYQFSAPEYACVVGGDYALMVHHGKENDKTVVWLQPGQECWPGHPNCGRSDQGASPEEVLETMLSSANGSPFGPGRPDKDNPLVDWNFVYVPSCDGSFHFGDAAADYDGDAVVDHNHNGLRQTSAAFNIMKDLFPDTKKILLAGSSTGGFGTFGAIPLARLTFDEARIYVLNDSGPGVFSTKEPPLWPLMMQTWNLEPMFPSDCSACRH